MTAATKWTMADYIRTSVDKAFDAIELAEEEIEASVKSWYRQDPAAAERVWNVFGILCPGLMFRDVSSDVYRHHVRELIERAFWNDDTRPGTKAEVLVAISNASLQSRLDRDVELLGLKLANELFPNRIECGDLAGESPPASTAPCTP
jgi:hypothetical protein